MAGASKKSFIKMSPQERDQIVDKLDREILFEETRPLSPKSQALWERARRGRPHPAVPMSPGQQETLELLGQAKSLAQRYYKLTGRPLGVTGEVAEFEAIHILGLEPAPVRQAGYDAVRHDGANTTRIQIKGRCVQGCKPAPGQRLGRIQLTHDWDAVLLVLLDCNLDAMEMYEADRVAVAAALDQPGSKSRNERGALSISKFKAIGRLVWQRRR